MMQGREERGTILPPLRTARPFPPFPFLSLVLVRSPSVSSSSFEPAEKPREEPTKKTVAKGEDEEENVVVEPTRQLDDGRRETDVTTCHNTFQTPVFHLWRHAHCEVSLGRCKHNSRFRQRLSMVLPTDGDPSTERFQTMKPNRNESEASLDGILSTDSPDGKASQDAETALPPSLGRHLPQEEQHSELPAFPRLSSYVSEPASTLQAWRVIAKEEEERSLREILEEGGEGANTRTAGEDLGEDQPSTLQQPMETVSGTNPSPFSFEFSLVPIRDHAWLHNRGTSTRLKTDIAHSDVAGDLATTWIPVAGEGGLGRGVERKKMRGVDLKSASGVHRETGEAAGGTETKGMAVSPIHRILPVLRIMRKTSKTQDSGPERTESGHGTLPDISQKKQEAFTAISPSKMSEGRELSLGDFDGEFGIDPRERRSLWHRRHFWAIFISVIIFFVFIIIGICLLVYAPSTFIENFQFWRLSFFIAGLPVIWWLGRGIANLVVWAVQRSMFSVKHALYFSAGLQYPLRNVIRSALAVGWWALIMTVKTQNQEKDVTKAYNIVLRIWACVTLFMTANLLKRMLAKMLALRYNKSQHLDRLTDAERKESILRYLLNAPSSKIPTHEESHLASYIGSGGILHAGHRLVELVRFRRYGSMGDIVSAVKRKGSRKGAISNGSQEISATAGALPPPPMTAGLYERGTKLTSIGEEDEEDSARIQRLRTMGRDSDGVVTSSSQVIQRPGSPTVRIQMASPQSSPRTRSASASPKSPSKISRRASGEISRPELARLRLDMDTSTHSATAVADARDENASSPGLSSRPMGPEGLAEYLERPSPVQSHAPSLPASRFGSRENPIPKHQFMRQLSQLERRIRKNALTFTWKDEMNKEGSIVVESEEEANRVGEYLYLRLNDLNPLYRRGVPQSRLEEILEPDDAAEAFQLLDADGNGIITKDDCVDTVVAIYQDRKNLAKSLSDVRSITAVLETLIGIVLHVIFVFFYLLIFEADIGQLWISFSGIVLAFSFIFGNSVRSVYENVVFLFACHPYDIGDVLFLDDNFYTVDQITITFTVCKTSNGQRVWLPNQRLLTTTFVNLSTSGNHCESIRILVDLDTPPETLNALEKALEELRTSYPKEFAAFAVSFRDVAVAMKMTIFIWMEFAFNGTDLGRCSRARTMVHVCVAKKLTELGVSYTLPRQTGDGRGSLVVVGEEVIGLDGR